MDQHDEFIGEQITPQAGTFDAAAMARGLPGLPAGFIWRGRDYRIAELVSQWKSSGPCRNGSSEMYLRRHWFKVRTDPPAMMTIYFDRQAKDRGKPKSRWFIYSANTAT